MAREELNATTDVVTLAEHTDGVGTNVASRLEDAGIETVADILIAEEGALTDVAYVSDLRAARLRDAAERVAGAVPREVDLEATENVVSEAAIPLSVRRGEAVLTKTSAKGSVDIYHTQACPHVEANNLTERDAEWAERRDLDECSNCADACAPSIRSDTTLDSDPSPLETDPVADALDLGLGEKVEIVTEDGTSWSSPWCVVDVDESVSWTAPLGENFETRTVTLRKQPQSGRGYDLLVTGDEVWVAGEYNRQPYQRLWRVEQVRPVGRVAQSSYVQLQAQQRQHDARPEGDDSWKQYQNRGETA